MKSAIILLLLCEVLVKCNKKYLINKTNIKNNLYS